MSDYEISMKVYKAISETCINVMEYQGEYVNSYSTIYEQTANKLISQGLSKENIDAVCSIKDVKSALGDVDKLAELGIEVDKRTMALYKFYENAFGDLKGFEGITNYGVTEIETISKWAKSLENIKGYSNGVLVVSALVTAAESTFLICEGKEDEAGAKLRAYV